MITKEERVYFIDPLQPASAMPTKSDGTALPLQIVALRYRRDGLNHDRIGSVITVTHQRAEGGELWWVDEGGDYVYGAQLTDRVPGRGNIMAIISDDLFMLGRNGGDHYYGSASHGAVITNARRSDGKRIAGHADSEFSYVSPLVIKAASWANDLMPVAGDSPEVVQAKVARAKQKYIQRHKKGEIYKEGMRRDWLHHLDSLRADHDMPTPVFNIGIEGTVLVGQPDPVAMADLEATQQDRLRTLTNRSLIHPTTSVRDDHAQTFVGKPFSVVTTLTASDLSQTMAVSATDIRYAVFDKLRIHSGHIIESTRFPILTSF